MKIKDIINEIGNAPYDYQKGYEKNPSFSDKIKLNLSANANFIVYSFVTENGDKYKVWLKPIRHNYKDSVEVAFAKIATDENGKETYITDVTGTRDSFKIFSTIKSILSKYIEKKLPNYILFSAKKSDKSRVDLYHKFALNASKIFPGYDKSRTKHTYDAVEYTLKKTEE